MIAYNAIKILLDCRDIFGKAHWWLDCGTLLGAVREGKFIAHDLDLDVGILEEQWREDHLKQFLSRGFKLVHTFGYRDYGYEVSIVRDKIKLDIFLYYKLTPLNNTERWFACWKNGFRNGHQDIIKMNYPAELVERRKFIEFIGYELPIPFDAERFLEIRYGAGWRTPDKEFRWDKDPKNIV